VLGIHKGVKTQIGLCLKQLGREDRNIYFTTQRNFSFESAIKII
jgi:hypothetical protein